MVHYATQLMGILAFRLSVMDNPGLKLFINKLFYQEFTLMI